MAVGFGLEDEKARMKEADEKRLAAAGLLDSIAAGKRPTISEVACLNMFYDSKLIGHALTLGMWADLKKDKA